MIFEQAAPGLRFVKSRLKKITARFVLTAALGAALLPPLPGKAFASEEIARRLEAADARLAEVTEENCELALQDYDETLGKDPENYETHWRMARAYCYLLDLKTSQLIEEKDEFKPLLKTIGEKAEFHGKQAYRLNPLGIDGLVWYIGAMAYHASSMGIVNAILNGSGTRVKKFAEELSRRGQLYPGAFGSRVLGRYYMAAPFPVGSKSKAVRYLEKSVQTYPPDLANHYFLARAYRAKGEHDKAARELRFVLENPAPVDTRHLEAFYKEAARRDFEALTASKKEE